MFYDEIEQGVLDAFRADDMPRARTGMAQLLAEELKELVPATEAAAKTREHFDGKLNHETDTVFLQFITSRAEAEKAVFELAVVSGDLLSLLEYAQSEKIDKNLAPREVIRLAVLAADFLKWLYQPSGQQRLLHLSGYAKRKSYWTVELEPEDAASEAMIKLLGTLPSSESYMYRAICSRYLDAARKEGLNCSSRYRLMTTWTMRAGRCLAPSRTRPASASPTQAVFQRSERKRCSDCWGVWPSRFPR